MAPGPDLRLDVIHTTISPRPGLADPHRLARARRGGLVADERREQERSPGDRPRRGHVAEAREDPQRREDILEEANERTLASAHVLRRVRRNNAG